MQSIKKLGFLGLLASVMVGTGEYLLHYSPNVLDGGVEFSFFKSIPFRNIKLGHYLAVAGIPFYFAGYLHIYLMLKNGSQIWANAVLALGFIAFSVGGVWISSREALAFIVQSEKQMSNVLYKEMIGNYKDYYEIMVNILRVVIALLSIAFVVAVLKGNTNYNKIMVFFNPITILIFFVVLGTLCPKLGKYFIPILMNATHFILFSASLFFTKQPKSNLLFIKHK